MGKLFKLDSMALLLLELAAAADSGKRRGGDYKTLATLAPQRGARREFFFR